MAAYSNSPLSNAHYCPAEAIPALNKQMLLDFKKHQFYGDNCVIAAAGIDHGSLVKLVSDRFNGLPRRPPASYTPRSPSVYTGGLHLNERELKEPFTRVCIGFECGGWNDPSLVSLCVLQTLLGGGSSFSAGGPGKGMYTRLYREVLNRCYWAESAEAFLTAHEASGIFGIDASCELEYVPKMIQIIIQELIRLSVEPVRFDELSRAKNMLKSQMMMQLESRMVVCEDIGRQMITYGKRQPAHELCAQIDAMQAEDLLAVSRRMVVTYPIVGIVGPTLTNIPSYQDIQYYTNHLREKAFKNALLSSARQSSNMFKL